MTKSTARLAFLSMVLNFWVSCTPLWAHPRDRNYDDWSCQELLDIRNFGPRRIDHPEYAEGSTNFTLTVRRGANEVTVRIPQRDHLQITKVQFIANDSRDTELQNILEGVFQQFFKPGGRDKGWNPKSLTRYLTEVEIGDFSNVETLRRLKGVERVFRQGLLDPIQDKAATVSYANPSERIQAIRELLSNFLKRQGVTEDHVFLRLRLSQAYNQMFQSLTLFERSVFHISIFDRELTFEAQATMGERLNEWKNFGSPEATTVADVVNRIRHRFYSIASDLHETHLAQIQGRNSAVIDAMNRRLQGYLGRRKFNDEKLTALLEKTRFSKRKPRVRIAYLERRLKNIDRQVRNLKEEIEQAKLHFSSSGETSNATSNDPIVSSNNNFNPYGLEIDHTVERAKTWVHLKSYSESRESSSHGAQPLAIFPAIHSETTGKLGLDSLPGWGEGLSEGSDADAVDELSETSMSEGLVAKLNQFGITTVYELTRYSAQDYLDKFKFSLDEMDEFLDEMNALGIHLYFDADWDRKNHRIRKRHPEFFVYRHTPKVIWREAPTPSEETKASGIPKK